MSHRKTDVCTTMVLRADDVQGKLVPYCDDDNVPRVLCYVCVPRLVCSTQFVN